MPGTITISAASGAFVFVPSLTLGDVLLGVIGLLGIVTVVLYWAWRAFYQ